MAGSPFFIGLAQLPMFLHHLHWEFAGGVFSTVEVKAAQTEDLPKVYKDIYIAYKFKTDKENEDKLRKAIDLSLEKYCGVSAMLQKNSPIHYTLEIL